MLGEHEVRELCRRLGCSLDAPAVIAAIQTAPPARRVSSRAPGRNGTENTNKRKRVDVLWLCNAVGLSLPEGCVRQLGVDAKLVFLSKGILVAKTLCIAKPHRIYPISLIGNTAEVTL
jgi:hypothetical protein